MDRSESYMTERCGGILSLSLTLAVLSPAELDVSYAEVNFKIPSAPRVRADRDGVNSTYSDVNFRKEEPRIDGSEDPSIASGPGRLSTTAQTAAQERASSVKIGNRPYRLICIICLVTSALILTVAGVLIHGERKGLRMESDDHAFSQDWIRNEDGCFFISTCNLSFDEAKQNCTKSDSKLLEINSAEEENFFNKTLHDQGISYWIGKCKDGDVASNALGRINGGDFECGKCTPHTENKPCDQVRTRFICEKSAPLCPDISEKIEDLCHQPVRQT
ncbi:killer cell lectin-like receptor subfamily B member 1B allele A [Hemitrygon akajei]|uniref:killer cell lectin-like receptor subfamily B member 1B allele A n=1 Tax=Hemitrygon akajei TaxID=2704970 RepID=UPI003BF9BDC9